MSKFELVTMRMLPLKGDKHDRTDLLQQSLAKVLKYFKENRGSCGISISRCVHREHTILLSRESVNKGTKRMNSLPLLFLAVISFILHDFTRKTAAHKSLVAL